MIDEALFDHRHDQIRTAILQTSKTLYKRHLKGTEAIYLQLDQNTPDLIFLAGHIDQVRQRLESPNVVKLPDRSSDELAEKRRHNLELTLRNWVMDLFDLIGNAAAFLSLLEEKNASFIVVGGPTQEVLDLVQSYDPDWPSPLSVLRAHAHNNEVKFTEQGVDYAGGGIHICAEESLTEPLLTAGYLEKKSGQIHGELIEYMVLTEKGKFALLSGQVDPVKS